MKRPTSALRSTVARMRESFIVVPSKIVTPHSTEQPLYVGDRSGCFSHDCRSPVSTRLQYRLLRDELALRSGDDLQEACVRFVSKKQALRQQSNVLPNVDN